MTGQLFPALSPGGAPYISNGDAMSEALGREACPQSKARFTAWMRDEVRNAGGDAGLKAIREVFTNMGFPQSWIEEALLMGSMPDWLHGTAEMPVGTPNWCSLAMDKIEGLTTDLQLTVQVAWRRGAKDWVRLNYPQWVAWLEACDEAP
jgi:hypothetical protein